MATLAPFIFAQYSDDSGNPLSGGSITSYVTGTSTPLDTYSDQAGTTPNSNPVVLDSAGRATIYLGISTYDLILKNSGGTTIKTYTGVNASSGGGTASLQIAATLAEMRTLPSGSSNYVILGGYSTSGDGVNEMYYWSSSSTATDDGATAIPPTVVRPSSNPATGRWLISKRYYQGTFTVTLTGVTTTVTGTAEYHLCDGIVNLSIPVPLSGTSNSTSCTLTGLPGLLQTTTNIILHTIPSVKDNSVIYPGCASINAGTIDIGFMPAHTGGYTFTFTGSGTKGIALNGLESNINLVYPIGQE